MILRCDLEPFDPQVKIHCWMGPTPDRLRYVGGLLLDPEAWEALVGVLVQGPAEVLAVNGTSLTMRLRPGSRHTSGA